MKLSALAFIGCLAVTVNAFQYPEFVPLYRRQEPGTPAYECHANCEGGAIIAARTNGYCDASDFKSELSACLDCALEYDIWKYYGNSVSGAATKCGLDATPIEPASTTTGTVSTGTSQTTPSTTTPGFVETTPGSVSSSSSPTSHIPTPSPSAIVFEGSTSSSTSSGGLLFGLVCWSIVAAFI